MIDYDVACVLCFCCIPLLISSMIDHDVVCVLCYCCCTPVLISSCMSVHLDVLHRDDQVEGFMLNFGRTTGRFSRFCQRWSKWADSYNHLPISGGRMACPVIYHSEWGGKAARQEAVGPEFTRAILSILWPVDRVDEVANNQR